MKNQIKAEIINIIDRTITLKKYMQDKIIEQDWHGVADCAMDLRDLESEIKGLEYAIKLLEQQEAETKKKEIITDILENYSDS